MEAFGGEFDLPLFKAAFETVEDMEAYNHVQAIERAVGRVQGFVADMAMDGVRLAQLPSEPEGGEGFRAKHAFAALRETGVIDGKLCRLLVESQEARTAIEHEYIRLRAGRLHQATLQVRDSSREFYELFRAWIEPYLD